MSILDLRTSGNPLEQVNLSAAGARAGIGRIRAAEIQHTSLASRIYAQTRSQSTTDLQREKTEARDNDRLREQADQIRAAVRTAIATAIRGVESSIALCATKLKNARHPLREIESLPLRGYIGKPDEEKRRRATIAGEGERCTLRAMRLTATATPGEFVAEVRDRMAEKNLDAVGSMLEAAVVRWKKLPTEVESLIEEIERTDFFHEYELKAELEEKVACLDELKAMLDERPAIVAEAELKKLKAWGAVAPQSIVEPWID